MLICVRRLQILVIPLPSAESHTFVMVKIVEELVARGNDILVSGCACDYLYSDRYLYLAYRHAAWSLPVAYQANSTTIKKA